MMVRSLLSRLPRLVALLVLAAAAPLAGAVDESDLLPVEQAFQLRASAPERGRIELHWAIAPGYYLYRHRTSAKADPAFHAGELAMPDGAKKHDPFFGDVQTYHGQLDARLPGQPEAGLRQVSVEVHYQGCADAGVCYPPQKRVLQVALPATAGAAASDAAPAPAAATAPAAPAGLPGSGGSGGLSLPGAAPVAGEALPLPPEQAFRFEAIVGDGNTLLLRFTPAPGYYLYRDRTSFALEGASGVRPGRAQWPAGQPHRDEHFGQTTVYFGQAEVTLPLQRKRADAVQATLVATFQGCQTDGICYPPMTRRVRLAIPAGTLSTGTPVSAAPLLRMPVAGAAAADAPVPAASGEGVMPTPGQAAAPAATAAPADPADASADNAGRSLPPADRPLGLLVALGLALLGGLILNLMPCVLPILSLKVLGLAQSGESRAHARAHALWYTLGVLVSFTAIGALVLALRAAGQAAGWGFQLQQPWFVGALVYLMFAVGLSLSGVYTFTLGSRAGGLGQLAASRRGAAGDFLTGALACLVASPCIAPFMGPALAYAFLAPVPVALLVFACLGLGLALPFLLIGFVPALAQRLPRPGAWMDTLKQVLAFPMYLTAIWLLWVLGKQRGVDALAVVLAGLAVMALGLWCYERYRWRERRPGMAVGVVLVLASLAPLGIVAHLHADARAATAGDNTVAYSPQMLDRLRASNRVVFVDITADWCVTCKANERNVIARAPFREAMRRVDAVYMVGDWTNTDPQISAFLEEHRAVGVPLYVVYGPGAPPRVLPTVLTQAVVEDALQRAGG
ncbi:protein-disulfide reductase DsbD family protein [Xanthomonas massiliensis]|jgi:thiol:disulfide interchange protein DsbD|uniref:protein-disulfide reductase DsbD family protein n=1 Tax=Xanthomonas massiliensis TaxID=1720302 RepID=UPI000824B144|nr:protein-disulfide reductase DsbD [Xanthomonas massiliensis]